MGRIGWIVQTDNPGAGDAEWVARDRLAHELMYFSRGNPVIYYGDEQGFTGSGGDQVARQTMFASQVPDYLDDDLLGTDATHAQDNFVAVAPALPVDRRPGRAHPGPTRRCATARSSTATPPSGRHLRVLPDRPQATSGSTWSRSTTASRRRPPPIPTYAGTRRASPSVYGGGPGYARTAADGAADADRAAAVHRGLPGHRTTSRARTAAPSVSLSDADAGHRRARAHARDRERRRQLASTRSPSTRRSATARGAPSAPTTTRPTRCSTTSPTLQAGTPVRYKAVVLDNGGHTSTSAARSRRGAAAARDDRGARRGQPRPRKVEVRAVADPERASHVVTIERKVADGAVDGDRHRLDSRPSTPRSTTSAR